MIRQKRDKRRGGLASGGGGQRQFARPCQPPPIVYLLRTASMPLRELRDHYVRRQALNHNARLRLVRPAAPFLAAGVNLDPARRKWLRAVTSVVRMVHCPLHGTVRNRSARTPLRVSEGSRSTAYTAAGEGAQTGTGTGIKDLLARNVKDIVCFRGSFTGHGINVRDYLKTKSVPAPDLSQVGKQVMRTVPAIYVSQDVRSLTVLIEREDGESENWDELHVSP
jgi:hypothetical protein